MSIHDEILDRHARGMLHHILPRARGATVRRALFVTEGLHEVLTSPEGDLEWEERIAKLQADVEVFVQARTITPKYLFLLYPAADAVWEIRSTTDQPSIRVLGLFADTDVFIATNFALRETLGGWQSRDWKTVKRVARAEWRKLFNTYEPLKGTDVHKFVTGAASGKFFKTPPRQ